jgi:hypothetical protein
MSIALRGQNLPVKSGTLVVQGLSFLADALLTYSESTSQLAKVILPLTSAKGSEVLCGLRDGASVPSD